MRVGRGLPIFVAAAALHLICAAVPGVAEPESYEYWRCGESYNSQETNQLFSTQGPWDADVRDIYLAGPGPEGEYAGEFTSPQDDADDLASGIGLNEAEVDDNEGPGISVNDDRCSRTEHGMIKGKSCKLIMLTWTTKAGQKLQERLIEVAGPDATGVVTFNNYTGSRHTISDCPRFVRFINALTEYGERNPKWYGWFYAVSTVLLLCLIVPTFSGLDQDVETAVIVVGLWLRFYDVMTDWGLYIITLSRGGLFSVRYNDDGGDFDTFQTCALVSCILGTILFILVTIAQVVARDADTGYFATGKETRVVIGLTVSLRFRCQQLGPPPSPTPHIHTHFLRTG